VNQLELPVNPTSLCTTRWAQAFLSEAASQFPQALQYSESCDHFLIIQSDEIGPVKFAIVPPDNTEFWMAGYDTLEEAIALCNEMGWRYEICE
jgi:hypothetical protein